MTSCLRAFSSECIIRCYYRYKSEPECHWLCGLESTPPASYTPDPFVCMSNSPNGARQLRFRHFRRQITGREFNASLCLVFTRWGEMVQTLLILLTSSLHSFWRRCRFSCFFIFIRLCHSQFVIREARLPGAGVCLRRSKRAMNERRVSSVLHINHKWYTQHRHQPEGIYRKKHTFFSVIAGWQIIIYNVNRFSFFLYDFFLLARWCRMAKESFVINRSSEGCSTIMCVLVIMWIMSARSIRMCVMCVCLYAWKRTNERLIKAIIYHRIGKLGILVCVCADIRFSQLYTSERTRKKISGCLRSNHATSETTTKDINTRKNIDSAKVSRIDAIAQETL